MRILLDTNIWRYTVDGARQAELMQAVRRSPHDVLIAPAVVYEAFRTRDLVLRKNLVTLMTEAVWKRLMPEAFSETEEIRREIKRLRPEWLRPINDSVLYKRLCHDWRRATGGFWSRARNDTAGEARRVQVGDVLDLAREQSYVLREQAKEVFPPSFTSAPLRKNMASFEEPRVGWDGKPFEMWRMDGYNTFNAAIQRDPSTFEEWLGGEVALEMLRFQEASHIRFWANDVDVLNMPRHWLRSGFEFQQRFHKVTDGTPGDCQLGTYLVEADVMLSADKNFVRMAERCREEAPFPMAHSFVVPGGPEAVDAVLDLVKLPRAAGIVSAADQRTETRPRLRP